jgi:outer membrane lipoprotein SlyB
MNKEMKMPQHVVRLLRVWVSALLLMPSLALAASDDTPVRTDEGKIEAIEIYRAADTKPINPGTVIGGIAGGVIGHQIGGGRGNTAATIAGTIGGAVVGNEIEKKHAQTTRYRITVRLDSGGTMIIDDTRELNLRVGDRVRVDGNSVRRI